MINDKIYIIGGTYAGLALLSARVDVYDPATDTWERKTDMTRARTAAAHCVLDGLIYIIGGSTSPWPQDDITTTVEVYDPIADSWSERSSLSVARQYFSACVCHGHIYVIGGMSSGSPFQRTNTIEVYAPFQVSVEKKKETMPLGYHLSQNYPNPFNPATTIEYSLPYASFVTLNVYNLLGEEMCTLVQEQQAAGSHSAVFHAAELPSNIYFYKLEGEGVCEIRKMVLMR